MPTCTCSVLFLSVYFPIPCFLNIQTAMDVVLASSRGKGLEALIRSKHPSPDHLIMKSTSPAKLRNHSALLKHCKQYPTMQENIISSLLIINTNIIGINKSHGAYTPKLADAIITKSGGTNHRVHYSRLVDGVHPTQSVKEEWANMILQAIDKNRSSFTPSRMKSIPSPPSSDSDSDSDPEHDHQRNKRKWLY